MRLVVADDHADFRKVLREAIEQRRGNWEVREAEDGEQALELCHSAEPDIVILDLNMPKMDGLATLGLLRCRHPATRVILISMYDDEELVGEAIRLGALSYVLKDDGVPNCLRAVDLALEGRSYLSPALHPPG